MKDQYGNTVQSKAVYLRAKVAITTQPTSKSVAINKSVSTTVKATGLGLKYTWYYKDVGASSFTKSSITSATYSTTMTAARSGRQVYCKITDKYGYTTTTNTVTLKAKVSITTQPVSKTVAKNQTASVTVKATGVGLKYTWYYKDAGAKSFTKSSTTSATYSTTMNSARNGRQLYCVITDKYGNVVQTNTVTLKMK